MRKTLKRRRGAPKKAARSSTGKKTTKSVAGRGTEPPTREEEAAFAKTLIESGQAARLDDQGKLPAGATHKVIEDEHGNVKVVRRRFSMT